MLRDKCIHIFAKYAKNILVTYRWQINGILWFLVQQSL